TILHHDLRRHGLPTVEKRLAEYAPVPLPLIDPHVIDKQCDRYVKGYGQRKLKPTCEGNVVQLDARHTAESDALLALLITEVQFERCPQLNHMGPQQRFAA